MKEKRIAFIGSKEYVNIMRFVGFECFGVSDEEEGERKIKELKKDDYALIFISQDVCPKDIGLDRVVAIPGITKASDSHYLKNEITKALGGEYEL